jgi:TonB family protein
VGADRSLGQVRVTCSFTDTGGVEACRFAEYANPSLRATAQTLFAILRFEGASPKFRPSLARVTLGFTLASGRIKVLAETPGARPIEITLATPDAAPGLEAYAAPLAGSTDAPGWAQVVLRCRVGADAGHECFPGNHAPDEPRTAAIGEAAAQALRGISFHPTTVDGRPVEMTVYYTLSARLPLKAPPDIGPYGVGEDRATVTCSQAPSAELKNCVVDGPGATPNPPAFPWGEYVAAPSAGAAGVVRFPIRRLLRDGREVIRAEPEGAPATEVTPPNWLKFPGWEDFSRVYPEKALRHGVEGTVTLACLAELDGSVSDCRVSQEAPADYGFGAAALQMAPRFKVFPGEVNGRVVARMPILAPIKFKTPR